MVRQSAEVRREKQRLRQRAYRARKRNERMPSYEDLARAALDVALTYNLKHGRHQQLLDLLETAERARTLSEAERRAQELGKYRTPLRYVPIDIT